MATNSGRGNSGRLPIPTLPQLLIQPSKTPELVGSEDNPPTPDLHPPPVSDEFKKEVQDAEAGDATGKREAGHDESSSLPATSVATGEQGTSSPYDTYYARTVRTDRACDLAEKVIRTAADMGGK